MPHRSPEMDERYTPGEVYGPLHRIFDFTLDPCAEISNRLLTPRFFTKAEDGLTRDWGGMKAFVNPPYSNIMAWATKAVMAAQNGAFVAFLIPNDCSTQAWKLLNENAWGKWNIPFRAKFDTPLGQKKDVARSHVVFFLGGLP